MIFSPSSRKLIIDASADHNEILHIVSRSQADAEILNPRDELVDPRVCCLSNQESMTDSCVFASHETRGDYEADEKKTEKRTSRDARLSCHRR